MARRTSTILSKVVLSVALAGALAGALAAGPLSAPALAASAPKEAPDGSVTRGLAPQEPVPTVLLDEDKPYEIVRDGIDSDAQQSSTPLAFVLGAGLGASAVWLRRRTKIRLDR